jgi:hypothetical protein
MKKIKLKLGNASLGREHTLWANRFDEIMSLKHNFQSIYVNCDDSHAHNCVELFVEISSYHGTNLRSLCIHKAEFKYSKDFCDILRNVPLLQELEVSRTSFKLSEAEEFLCIRPVKLKHLKTIKVVYSSWVFFRYLIGSQIASLVLHTAQVRPSEREDLVCFLETQKKLTHVEIDREAFERIFQIRFDRRFPFKLKKFKYFSYTFKSEVNQIDENFIEFLESQAKSIEDLALEYSSREILQTIFTRLVHLKRLKLNSNSLPTDKEFYDQLRTFEQLVEFDADDRIPNSDAAKGILKNAPQLQILKVECDPNDIISEILPFIAKHNPKLTTLMIDSFKVEHKPEVKFKYLTTLHVFLFKHEDLLLRFLNCNPTITTLKVKWIYEQTFIDQILHDLMDKTSLKHLKFGGKPETMRAIHTQIKSNHKMLKSLELNFKTDNGIETSFYEFPENTTQFCWDTRHDYFDTHKY